jgi:hypothetical protein
MTLALGEGISGAVCVRGIGTGTLRGETVTCFGDCLAGPVFGTAVFGTTVLGETVVCLGTIAKGVGVLGATT